MYPVFKICVFHVCLWLCACAGAGVCGKCARVCFLVFTRVYECVVYVISRRGQVGRDTRHGLVIHTHTVSANVKAGRVIMTVNERRLMNVELWMDAFWMHAYSLWWIHEWCMHKRWMGEYIVDVWMNVWMDDKREVWVLSSEDMGSACACEWEFECERKCECKCIWTVS